MKKRWLAGLMTRQYKKLPVTMKMWMQFNGRPVWFDRGVLSPYSMCWRKVDNETTDARCPTITLTCLCSCALSYSKEQTYSGNFASILSLWNYCQLSISYHIISPTRDLFIFASLLSTLYWEKLLSDRHTRPDACLITNLMIKITVSWHDNFCCRWIAHS